MKFKDTVKGKPKFGVQVFADSFLIIPKVLAQYGGFDQQDTLVTLLVLILCFLLREILIGRMNMRLVMLLELI